MHQGIRANDSVFFAWYCDICDCLNPFSGVPYIAKEVIRTHLSESEIEDLPVKRSAQVQRCARCHRRGGEVHHWAPQAKFPDAEKWPQDILCKDCHDEWHAVMNFKA